MPLSFFLDAVIEFFSLSNEVYPVQSLWQRDTLVMTVDALTLKMQFSLYIFFPLNKFCLHSLQFSINWMISICPHSFLFNLSRIKFLVADWIGLFFYPSLPVSSPTYPTAWWDPWARSKRVAVARFLSLTLYLRYLVCLRCYVFSAAFLNLTTRPSPWSSRIAVPLPFLVFRHWISFHLGN